VQNKKAHGGLQQYWLHLFEYFQAKLLEDTDVAVVSSDLASHLFDLRYPDFSGKKLQIPLMYEDLGGWNCGMQDRKYVSFVGPPVPAKNPEKFLEIVRYSNNHDLNLRFLLISRSPLEDKKCFREKNLEVFCKERITDEEFGGLLKKSVAVVTPYKRETQSSVVLVSYMHGTPVVSSNTGGLPEFVSQGKTGYLLDADADVEEWIEAIRHVQENLPVLSKNCRKYFVKNFSGENWRKYLDALIA
jgi:glycosyltransferase involved in cell wall biosynthesis